jgi:hypothetical protein
LANFESSFNLPEQNLFCKLFPGFGGITVKGTEQVMKFRKPSCVQRRLLFNLALLAANAMVLPHAALVAAGDTLAAPQLDELEQWNSEVREKVKRNPPPRQLDRSTRIPILGRITNAPKPMAIEPPTDEEIMAVLRMHARLFDLPKTADRVEARKVKIEKDVIAQYADPLQFYPLIGKAKLHHTHYKCTVHFIDTTGPRVREETRVIYIDHNHFHME